GVGRFFFYAEDIAFLVKFRHAVSLWIIYIVTEDDCFLFFGYGVDGVRQQIIQPCSIKNIISEYQTDIISPNKLFSYNKSLCQSIRRRLFGIMEINSQFVSVTQ